jgi:hypothetical protein
MSNFPQPLGTLSTGGKRRVFNPSILKRPGEELPLEQQYDKALTKEEKSAIFKKIQDEHARERAQDRMLIC